MSPEQSPPEGSEPPLPPDEESSPQGMGFLEHLEALRVRLIRAILFLAVGTIICLIFSRQLLGIITATFGPGDQAHLALLHPTEGFVVRLKVAFVGGLFLSSPLWLGQLWGFISPGLYRREKRALIPVIAASSGAFILGAGFGYWILPHAADYFRSFATPEIAVNWSLGRYLDFSLRLIVAFALVFELPLAIFAAARLGIVTTAQLRRYRRHAVIAVLFVAALITPPDIFTMIVLALPLILLYEAGIVMASLAVRKSRPPPSTLPAERGGKIKGEDG